LEPEKKKGWLEEIFFRRTAGHIVFDQKWNEEFLEEFKAEPADEKLRRYETNWPRHVIRMYSNRMLKITLTCRTKGRRRLGKTLEDV